MWSNLPVPIQCRFSCDQLALVFGTCLSDAAFVLDAETGVLVGANEKLLGLLGQDVDVVQGDEIPFERFVFPEDRSLFNTWVNEKELAPGPSFSVRLMEASGDVVPVDIRLKNVRWRRREYCLGFAEECRERHRRETVLQAEVEQQKQRSVKALESSLRMYELNEKIKSTLVLTTQLLEVDTEQSLFDEAMRVLTNSEGLNFKGVTFLVRDGSQLNVVRSTEGKSEHSYSLTGDNRYARLFRSGLPATGIETRAAKEIVVPLRSHDDVLGLLEVSQHQRERDCLDGSRPLQQWQRDMLEQIGDVIAILLDNLRLTRELERQSTIDPLTEAFNRKHFMNRLSTEIQRATRYDRPTALIFLDVDYFKQINDRYGHLQGDQVLRDLAQLFRAKLRNSDVLCRYGGDEFVVLLPETNSVMAQAKAETLVQSVREHHFANLDDPSQAVPVTISVGHASLTQGQDEERFLQSADAALYQAKREGRDRAATAVLA